MGLDRQTYVNQVPVLQSHIQLLVQYLIYLIIAVVVSF